MDKISYALGLSMGNNFLHTGIKTLNVEDFSAAIKAVFEGEKPAMSYEEAKQIINEYFASLQPQMLQRSKEEGEAFLAENKKNPKVVTLPSGLQYEILTQGNGPKPKATDRVRCHYHGTLINGQVFDSSVERGQPAVFGVSQVIPGWVEALQLMPVGSRWKLFIPSNLAYGEHGAGDSIAPNSALIFEVELIGIV